MEVIDNEATDDEIIVSRLAREVVIGIISAAIVIGLVSSPTVWHAYAWIGSVATGTLLFLFARDLLNKIETLRISTLVFAIVGVIINLIGFSLFTGLVYYR
jgi:hypothetical protein